MAMIICTLSLAASAWGPASRETFTIEEPPSHVVFNSITNNPAWGDERGIVQIKESDEPDSAWRSGITLQPGKSYDVRAYYHNNASASANGLSFDGPGVARGAYAQVVFPGYVDGEEFVSFILGAENAQHFNAAGQDLGREVFGNITLRSEQGLNVRYVDGSARLHNSFGTFELPMELFGADGTLIGYDTMNGIIPGGQGYDGVITFTVSVPNPSFMFRTTVAHSGSPEQWRGDISEVNPQVGDNLLFILHYLNNGDVNQDSVVVSSELIAGLEYVNGTTIIYDTFGSRLATHDTITSTGLIIGNFAPGAEAYVVFEAKVTDISAMEATFAVDTDNGRLESTLEDMGIAIPEMNKADTAKALNNVVTVTIFAALMALGIAVLVKPLEVFWRRVLTKERNSSSVIEGSENTQKIKFEQGLFTVVLGIVLLFAVVGTLYFSICFSKTIHGKYFEDSEEGIAEILEEILKREASECPCLYTTQTAQP
jgi:hypothetical protein